MSGVVFDMACKEDISELIRLRIAYMIMELLLLSSHAMDNMLQSHATHQVLICGIG